MFQRCERCERAAFTAPPQWGTQGSQEPDSVQGYHTAYYLLDDSRLLRYLVKKQFSPRLYGYGINLLAWHLTLSPTFLLTFSCCIEIISGPLTSSVEKPLAASTSPAPSWEGRSAGTNHFRRLETLRIRIVSPRRRSCKRLVSHLDRYVYCIYCILTRLIRLHSYVTWLSEMTSWMKLTHWIWPGISRVAFVTKHFETFPYVAYWNRGQWIRWEQWWRVSSWLRTIGF